LVPLVNNQAFAAFPSMSVGQEHLGAILFVIAIVGLASGAPVILFLLSVINTEVTTKTPKRFLLSNWN
jgi:hypothetical protein